MHHPRRASRGDAGFHGPVVHLGRPQRHRRHPGQRARTFGDDNLASALRHIRSVLGTLTGALGEDSGRPLNFWIDAVCINQKDVAERNSQVPLMAQLYTQAARVLAWFGPVEEKTVVGINTLGRIHLAVEAFPNGDDWLAAVPELCRIDEESELGNGAWSALYHVLTHPYWSRLWILQERVYAKTLYLMCRSAIVPFTANIHRMALRLVGWHGKDEPSQVPPAVRQGATHIFFGFFDHMRNLREHWEDGTGPRTALEAAQRGWILDATDARTRYPVFPDSTST